MRSPQRDSAVNGLEDTALFVCCCLAWEFGLTREEQRQLLPSGK
jgi:hypothetical protein